MPIQWLTDYPERGQVALTIITVVIAVTILWFGRKHLSVTIPFSLVFLLLAAIAIPSTIPARPAAQRNVCINNLQQIEEAKTIWEKQHQKSPGDQPTEIDLFGSTTNAGILRRVDACPAGGTYTIGALGVKPTCSLENRGHKLL